jgi:hypothetical protein
MGATMRYFYRFLLIFSLILISLDAGPAIASATGFRSESTFPQQRFVVFEGFYNPA